MPYAGRVFYITVGTCLRLTTIRLFCFHSMEHPQSLTACSDNLNNTDNRSDASADDYLARSLSEIDAEENALRSWVSSSRSCSSLAESDGDILCGLTEEREDLAVLSASPRNALPEWARRRETALTCSIVPTRNSRRRPSTAVLFRLWTTHEPDAPVTTRTTMLATCDRLLKSLFPRRAPEELEEALIEPRQSRLPFAQDADALFARWSEARTTVRFHAIPTTATRQERVEQASQSEVAGAQTGCLL